eukprot:TRINITY_DN5179_c0_g1_i2.p1 TRINITY_DN5179_c0_g1~~TRINITY_DN5179_c0_g1_i2.p1  ORF type:complete len:1634 (+),score=549.15 TRINITY_DN5179_c0_g1_i2:143-5044(+)
MNLNSLISAASSGGSVTAMSPAKDSLIRAGKIPSGPKLKSKEGKGGKESGTTQEIGSPIGSQVSFLESTLGSDQSKSIKKLTPNDLKSLIGKGSYPVSLILSSPSLQLQDDDFFSSCPNVLKELNLGCNMLVECNNLTSLTRLKRLWLDDNLLCSVNFKGLTSLESLSLAQNRMEKLGDMTDLKKLVYLDFNGNRLSSSNLQELSKLKNLKVLDLGFNSISLAINEFYHFILTHLKKIPKLEMLSFLGNPVEDQIVHFRHFILNELPKLKYIDWEAVTKEDKTLANKLDQDGVWDDHLLPLSNVNSHSSINPTTQTGSIEASAKEKAEFAAAAPAMLGASFSSFPVGALAAVQKPQKSKAQALEDLLEDGFDESSSNNKVSPNKEKSTLQLKEIQIESKKDPLDDIFDQLEDSSQKEIVSSRSLERSSSVNKVSKKIEESFKHFIDGQNQIPIGQIPDLPSPIYDERPEDFVDSKYLKVLQDHEPSSSRSSSTSSNNFVTLQTSDWMNSLDSALSSREGVSIPKEEAVPERKVTIELLNQITGTNQPQPQEPSNIPKSNSTSKHVLSLEDLESTIERMDIEESNQQQEAIADEIVEEHSPPLTPRSQDEVHTPPQVDSPSSRREKPFEVVEQVYTPPISKHAEKKPTLSEAETDESIKEKSSKLRMLLREQGIHLNNEGQKVAVPQQKTTQGLESKEGEVDVMIREQIDILDDLVGFYEKDRVKNRTVFEWVTNMNQIEMKEIIGEGISLCGRTFKSVWQGLKVTTKHIPIQEQSRKGLHHLVESMSRIQTENVLKIIGSHIQIAEANLYLISEYVEGMTVHNFIANKKIVLNFEQIHNVIKGIARGMESLHQAGIVHRSLKPKNIMLGDSFLPQIRDFGFCDMKDNFVLSNLFRLEDVEYLAPEVLTHILKNKRGGPVSFESSYDEKVDVYSFGIILWEIFEREFPFPNMSANQIVAAVLKEEIKPFYGGEKIPLLIWRLINLCTTFNPSSRPSFVQISKILSQPSHTLLSYTSTSSSNSEEKKETEETEEERNGKLEIVCRKVGALIMSTEPLKLANAAKAINSLSSTEFNIPKLLDFKFPYHLLRMMLIEDTNVQEAALHALYNLAQYDACHKTIREQNGLLQLINLIQKADEIGNENTQLLSTKLLTRLLKDDLDIEQFKSHLEEGMKALISQIRSSNELIQIQSVWTLSSLLSDVACQNTFLDEGGLSPLLKLLLSQHPGLQIRVLYSLGKLVHNEKAQERILRAGVIARFLDLMSSSSKVLQQMACKNVSTFSSVPRIHAEMIQHGAPELVVRLLQTTTSDASQPVDEEINEYLLKTLEHITANLNEDLALQLRKVDAISVVVRQFGIRKIDQTSNILSILRNLAEHQIDRKIFVQNGFLEKLTDILIRNSDSVSSHESFCTSALLFIEPFAFDDQTNGELRSESKVNCFLKLTTASHPQVSQKSWKILSELLIYDDVKNIVRSHGGLTKILPSILSPDVEIQESAIYAISYYSERAEERQLLVQMNAAEAILSLLQPFQPPISENGLNILQRSVSTMANLAMISPTSDSIRKGIPLILPYVNCADEALQSLSIKFVLLLCQNEENKRLLVEKGALQYFRQALEVSQNETIKKAGAKLAAILEKAVG